MKTRAEAATLILSLGLTGFVVMADNWVVSPILPSIAGSIGSTPIRAAILIPAYMLPFGLLQLFYGPLADRYGKLKVLWAAMIGFTVACGLTAMGASLTSLTVYRALTGAFAAAANPVSLALIGDTMRPEDRQSAIGSFLGISFLGQGLSMGVGGAIAYFVGWHGVFATYAAFSVVVTVLLIGYSRRLSISGNPHSQIIAPYRALLTNGPSLRTYLVLMAEGALVIGSFSFLGAFLSRQFAMNNLGIGLVMTGFGIATIVAGRLSGAVARRIGQKRTVLVGLLLAALGNLLIFATGGTLAVVVLAIALFGGGFMLAHSTLVALANNFAPKARGAAMSLVAVCFMGSGGAGTVLGGRLITGAGFTGLYGLCALLLALLAGVAFFAIDTSQPPIENGPTSKSWTQGQAVSSRGR